MKNFFLTWSVDYTMVQTVSDALQNEWNISFYLDSVGWNSSAAQAIIEMINAQKHRITLYANNLILSNAFVIFFYSECKRKVLPWCVWMTHMARIDTSMSGKMRIQTTPKMQMKFMMIEAKKQAKFLQKLGAHKKSCKSFLHEYDIYFPEKHLKNFLKKHEKMISKK